MNRKRSVFLTALISALSLAGTPTMTAFGVRGSGAPGSWVSYVDAGILEGIERGIVIAQGRSADTFGNPGSLRWASYLTELRDGLLTARSVHDKAWSEAEQASTEHGVALAVKVHGVPASGVEQRFYQFSTRPNGRQVNFLDWFTDVGNSTPSRRGADLAYGLAEFNLPGGTLSVLAPGLHRRIIRRLPARGAPDCRPAHVDRRSSERIIHRRMK